MDLTNTQTVDRLWTVEIDQEPAEPLLAAGGLLLLPTLDRQAEANSAFLSAYDLASGALRWRQPFPRTIISGVVAAVPPGGEGLWCFVTTSGREVFFDEGGVLALDENGAERWQWRGRVQMVSAPAVDDGWLGLTVDSEAFIALDRVTGIEKMRFPLAEPASFLAPLLVDGTAYIPGRGPYLNALSLKGSLKWRFSDETSGWLDKTPVLVENRLVAVSTRGEALCLEAKNGRLLWKKALGPAGKPLSPPAADGVRVYIGARDGLHALNLENGETAWHHPLNRGISARPLLFDQQLLIAGQDHFIAALDPFSGERLWQYEMGRRLEISPAAVRLAGPPPQQAIFAIDRGGQLAALRIEAGGSSPETGTEAPSTQERMIAEAERLEAAGELTMAAETWYQAGNLEQAAEKFELAGKWLRAAQLWHELARPLDFAQALEGHARALEEAESDPQESALVWEEAAQVYAAEGQRKKADFCRRQVARCRELPILELSVEHEGLVLNVWSRLKITVCNTGYGLARHIVVEAAEDRFSGEMVSTRAFFSLKRDETRLIVLTVRPRQYGDTVPLRLTLAYLDSAGNKQILEKTLFIPVAGAEADRVEGQMPNVFDSPAEARRSSQAQVSSATAIDAVALRRNLATYYSENELKDLCFELEIDHEDLARGRKSDFAREIILYLQRRGRLTEIVNLCIEKRPHVDWHVSKK